MDLNRNQFMLIGLVLLLFGLQLRFVDTFVLNEESTRFLAKQKDRVEDRSSWLPASLSAQSPLPVPRKKIHPPKWLGWSLITAGTILILHSLVLRKPD